MPFDGITQTVGRLADRRFSRVLFLDLETRSELDLKKVGSEIYARHPSTEIMCAFWALDDGEIVGWNEDHFLSLEEACPALLDPETLCVFHNADFEPRVLLHCAGVEIEVDRIVDSAAIARYSNLPGKLDPLGQYLGHEKDAEGNRIMLKLSKPRRPSKANPEPFWTRSTKPEDFARLDAYCARDVHVSREAVRALPFLSDFEWRAYRATYRMNERGFPIDRASAAKLWRVVERTRAAMSDRTLELYGFTLTQPAKIAEFLGVDSANKATIRDLLKDPDLDPEKRDVALARQLFAKTSVDKIVKMLSHSRETGSVHGGVIYGGAERTLRYSGAGVQPQNMPRGMGKRQELVFEALALGVFGLVYGGEELVTISEVLRGLIKRHEPGLLINVGDYSQIEARLLAWIVGDTELLRVFREGGDPYKLMAGKIYGKPEDQVTSSERFMGKQTVLGCGYGLGRYGFQTMLDETYDVQIEDDEAGALVDAYRRNAPKVVRFWKRLDRAILAASGKIGSELVIVPDRLSIKFTDARTFFLRLPSGRRLWYRDVEKKTTRKGVSWTCYGKVKGDAYGRVKIYGGALTGHIVQSTARDVIVDAMVRLDDLGHALILTVHDELVSLDDGDFEEFEAVMKTPPAWLVDFPLAVDAFQTERYRK